MGITYRRLTLALLCLTASGGCNDSALSHQRMGGGSWVSGVGQATAATDRSVVFTSASTVWVAPADVSYVLAMGYGGGGGGGYGGNGSVGASGGGGGGGGGAAALGVAGSGGQGGAGDNGKLTIYYRSAL